MALTITASTTSAYAVRLVIDGGVPPYVVDASPGGGREDYRVRSAYATVPGIPAQRIALDGDIPLNTPVVYVATDSTGAQAQTPPVTVHSDVPVLSDATDAGRALVATVVAQKPNRWEARSVWWDVLGASAPFASIAPMRYRNGSLVLRTEDLTARASMIGLLRPGTPLVLRVPCTDAVDDVTFLVESADESLVLEDDPAGPTLFALTYQAISRELGPTVTDPGRSYATVKAESATYAVALATFPTYDALRVGAPGGTLGPELVTGGDFSTGRGVFGTFWSTPSVTWTWPGLASALQTGAGPASAVMDPGPPVYNLPVVAGTRYRLSGRVRSSHASTTCYVNVLTNTAPDDASYFAPGVAFQALPVSSPGTWAAFSVDVVVPAGDNLMSAFWRADGMVDTAVVEWDDLSVRAVT